MELQLVELHFARLPCYDNAAIKARAEVILGNRLAASNATKAKDAFLLFHKDHIANIKDARVPAQTAILAAHKPIDITGYLKDIQQSWGFPDGEATLKQSCHSLLVVEMMCQFLSPNVRVQLFHGVLQAVIETTQPDALVFKHSQQVVQPDAYLAATSDPPIVRPGALNARFFNISNSAGDMLMDTRGLHEIGLHDLQCHFRALDPNAVGRVLLDTAVYLFENGPVIKSGNTVAGVEPGSKWVCQFEKSLLEPKRESLDLNPGPPYAAGDRN